MEEGWLRVEERGFHWECNDLKQTTTRCQAVGGLGGEGLT